VYFDCTSSVDTPFNVNDWLVTGFSGPIGAFDFSSAFPGQIWCLIHDVFENPIPSLSPMIIFLLLYQETAQQDQ
jgi:hypothetical protein